MSEIFSATSNLALTTRITVDHSREDFFSRESLNLNKLPSLQVHMKTTLSLQNCMFSSIVRLKRTLNLREDLLV